MHKNTNQQIFQLSFFKVKEENSIKFKEYRELYIKKRSTYTNSEVKLFESFFSFPKKNSKDVFIELTSWESLEEIEKVTEQLLQTNEAKQYVKMFSLQESFRMKTQDDVIFNMEELLKRGQAVEFAVRQIKPSKRKVYPKWRKRFLGNIITKKGYVLDQEFHCIDEDLDILLFVWDSVKHFEQAGKEVKRSPKVLLQLIGYFSLIKNRVFHVGQMLIE